VKKIKAKTVKESTVVAKSIRFFSDFTSLDVSDLNFNF